MHESIVFVVRVRCRRTESSRSLSHLLMSFLFRYDNNCVQNDTEMPLLAGVPIRQAQLLAPHVVLLLLGYL